MTTNAIQAIHDGDVASLKKLLDSDPGLVSSRADGARTLLHVATDWPGHFPNSRAIVNLLIASGADPNARFSGGQHQETPLHWAASSNDVEALDALLDGGADIEASGAVIGGGTPLADAVAFAQWDAARRLLERGATSNLWQSAALGLLERVKDLGATASQSEITNAFWCACHGGQRQTAEWLLAHGADMNWKGHDNLTPLGAAERNGMTEVAAWLRKPAIRK